LERLLDQLLSQSNVSIALPFFDIAGTGQISGAIAEQLTTKLAGKSMQSSSYDPPILLMPSLYGGLR
jgi:protease-4